MRRRPSRRRCRPPCGSTRRPRRRRQYSKGLWPEGQPDTSRVPPSGSQRAAGLQLMGLRTTLRFWSSSRRAVRDPWREDRLPAFKLGSAAGWISPRFARLQAEPLGEGDEPSISPVGRRVAYVRWQAVWLYDLAAGTTREVCKNSNAHGVTWNPSGTLLAFQGDDSVRTYAKFWIWLVNPDGSNLRRISEGQMTSTLSGHLMEASRLVTSGPAVASGQHRFQRTFPDWAPTSLRPRIRASLDRGPNSPSLRARKRDGRGVPAMAGWPGQHGRLQDSTRTPAYSRWK